MPARSSNRGLRITVPPFNALPVDPTSTARASAGAPISPLRASEAEGLMLSEIARELSGAGSDLGAALDLLAAGAVALLGAEGATVARRDPRAPDSPFRIDGAAGSMAAYRDLEVTRPMPLSQRAMTERRALWVNEAPAEPPLDASLVTEFGIRTVVVAPLVVEGHAVGVIAAFNKNRGADGTDTARGAFGPDDGVMLQRLADHGALAIRNAGLFADAQQSAREASALAEIVQQLNQSLELERVAALIARHAAELLGARGARVGVLEGDELVVVATHGGGAATEARTEQRIPIDELLLHDAMRRGCAVTAADVRSDPAWRGTARIVGDAGRPNAIVAPLLVGGRVIGGILGFGNDARDFGERDERMLMLLATHGAVAIENARLFRSAALTARHASVMAETAHALAHQVSPQAVYAEIGRVLRDSLGAGGFTIYLADVATQHAEMTFTQGVGQAHYPRLLEHFWTMSAGTIVRTATPMFLQGIDRADDERNGISAVEQVALLALHREGVRSLAMLPLVIEGQVRGILSVRYLRRRGFDAAERTLLADIAAQVAVAVRNALLFADLERRAARMTAVAQVQQAIAAAVSLRDVYAEIHRAVTSVVDAPSFVLLAARNGGERLEVEFAVVNGQEALVGDQDAPFPFDSETAAQTFHSRTARVAARARDGDGRRIVVELSAPVAYGDEVLGVLQMQSHRPDAYDLQDMELVTILARQAAAAIINARTFEEERRGRERERMLAGALATMDQPVLIVDVHERVRYANAAAVGEYGYALDELMGLALRELEARVPDAATVPDESDAVIGVMADDPGDSGRARSTAARTSATGEGGPTRVSGETDIRLWLAEHVHRRRDGTEFPASVTVGRLHDAAGQPSGLVVGVRDLTRERRDAERLRQTENLAALGELVAGVAHELNNPLTGISAFAQLLLEDPLEAEQLESVKLIKQEADRAVAVIRDLLIFSRKTGPRHLPVDVNALVEQTVRLRAYGLRSAGIDIVLDLDPAAPCLRGDDQKLQQVLLNLIVNAEYAMQHTARRTLMLRTLATATEAVLMVSDSGGGMPPETLRRVFEPFFTTKPAGVGTGLGLSVSYGIVRDHGGDILVESEAATGTTFRLSFPIGDAASSLPPSSRAAQP